MNLSLKRVANHLKNLLVSSSRPLRQRRARLGLESLEDRFVPSITSPDGLHHADIVQEPAGGFHVVRDNAPVSQTYSNIRFGLADGVSRLGFSPDSQHLVWVTSDAWGNQAVVEDGHQLPVGLSFQGISDYGFSPDSQHYAFVGKTYAGGGNATWSVYADGRSDGAYLSNLLINGYTSNSRFLNYTVQTGYGPETHSIALTAVPVISTSTTLTASTYGSVSGERVNYKATVRGAAGVPTGSVTFTVDGQPIQPSVVLNSAGDAILQLASHGVGQHTISAFYSGAAGFSASHAATPVVETVRQADSAVALASPTNPSVRGQTAAFTATVTAAAPGSGTPVGSVTFFVDGQSQAPAALDGAGQATLQLNSLMVGQHTISAAYNGSADFLGSRTLVPLTQMVNKADSLTTLVSSASPSVFGQSVTFTAGVSAKAPGSGIPVGSVVFVVDGGTPAAAPLNAFGQASLTLSSLAAGKHTISAAYNGSADFLATQTPVSLTQTVNLAIGPAALPAATAGQDYSTNLRAAGGSGNYTYALSGALPSGLSLSSEGVLSGRMAVAGTYHFTVVATDTAPGGVAGTQVCTLTVGAAAPASVVLTAPARATAGAGFSVKITAQDQYGNGCSGPVTLNSSDGQAVIPANVNLVNGVATPSVMLKTAGLVSLTATLGGVTASGTITVSPGAPYGFLVSAPATATAGAGFSVTVRATDAFGNTIDYSGPVGLFSSDGQAVHLSPATFMLSHGSGTATAALNVAHTVTLMAYLNGYQGISSSITVSPAAAASFTVSAPAKATAGAGFSVTVTAKDQFGNATNWSGTAALSSSDGQAVTPVNVTLSSGTGTAMVSLTAARVVTLSATSADGALKGSSGSVTVSAAAAASFTLDAPSTAVVGQAFAVTITARDRFGNIATGYTGRVKGMSSDGRVLGYVVVSNGKVTVVPTLWTVGLLTLSVTEDPVLSTSGPLTGTSGVITVRAS